MVRKAIFWMHLICGVGAGLVIVMMSATGVLLTYERQILDWIDREQYTDPAPGAERMPLDALLEVVARHDPEFVPTSLTVRNDPRAPITIAAGRSGTLLVNPHTGDVASQRGVGARAFFDAVEGWHRWFNVGRDNRGVARAITDASNFAFLFLVLSGVYLWLPRVFGWAAFKTRLLFNPKATSGKARDFNWHHVFGIWCAIPLAVIVACSVVFSYSWANDLVYRSVGDEPPPRGPGGPERLRAPDGREPRVEASADRLSYDALFAKAAAQAPGWRALTLLLPRDGAPVLRFSIDEGNGGQPQRRHSLVLDGGTGEVREWTPFSSLPPGQRARSWIRFLHTGEALGVAGQTVAGAASLASLLMAYTGLALAYRRLLAPLFKRKATPQCASTA